MSNTAALIIASAILLGLMDIASAIAKVAAY